MVKTKGRRKGLFRACLMGTCLHGLPLVSDSSSVLDFLPATMAGSEGLFLLFFYVSMTVTLYFISTSFLVLWLYAFHKPT